MIASMKYLSVVCMKDDREKLLTALQRCGEIMLCETENSTHGESIAGQNMRRMEKLMKDVKPYKGKKPLFAQNPEVEEAVFDDVKNDDVQTAEKIEALLAEISDIESAIQRDKTLINQLEPWERLNIPLEDIGESEYSVSMLGVIPNNAVEGCLKAADQCGVSIEEISGNERAVYSIAVYLKGESLTPIYEAGFEKAILPPVNGLVSDKLNELRKSSADNIQRLQSCNEELQKITGDSHSVELLFEQYKAENDREAAPFTETTETVVLEGWVPAERVDKLEKVVRKVTDVYDIFMRDPLPEEDPPTLLKNKYLVSQFEDITNMFSIPKYGENDPNGVMAPWYWVIFGLMMGDAGYGLMMVVLGLILKKLMKPKGGTAKLFNVILYSSITSIIAGILFGSYFGETFHPILFSPLDEPVKMLIFTLVVGVAHIFTGMITKIVINIKAGQFWDAIFDQVSWILVLTGLPMLFLGPTKTIGMILAIVGGLIVLFTAGRAKKGFGKVTGGLLGLYDVTSYLSDILSYSRILALSLATGVVGMVMNMLAGMLHGSIIGIILSIPIYVVGHVFNLVLGLLSAYVHACRLQYIEFYSKFYEGTGKLFKPFAITPKYIDIKTDGGNENG